MERRGVPLALLDAKRGPWKHSLYYEEMCVARAWGQTPDQWWAASAEARAVMVAQYRTQLRVEAAEQEERERKDRRRQVSSGGQRTGHRSRR